MHVLYVDNDKSTSLHPLHISRILTQIMNNDIIEIKKLGRNQVLVELRTFAAANKLVEDPSLEKQKLKAFVPSYRKVRHN